MRAARTDSGVSAAINVLNLKLILSPLSLPEGMTLKDHINSFLPPTIRVWDIIRTLGSFHSRTMCDSRMYNYSLPTYAFLEPKEGTLMDGRVTWASEEEKLNSYWRRVERTKQEQTKEQSAPPPGESNSEQSAATAAQPTPAKAPSSFAVDQTFRKQYRMPPETLKRVREAMNKYLGSHNFWNFTVGKEFSDRSCQRVMKALTVRENPPPWLHGVSLTVFAVLAGL